MSDKHIKVRAKKEGIMDEGEIFCHKNETYDAIMIDDFEFFEDPDERYWYFVEDELDKWGSKDTSDWHGMDKEFFDEYFEIIEK